MAARYRGAPPGALLVEPLDELTAVFHRPSGTTHLLASPAPELLAALGGDVLDAGELLDRLADGYDVADADADGGGLAARLDELAAAGLVEHA